jgi:hypothetical protein
MQTPANPSPLFRVHEPALSDLAIDYLKRQ